MKPFFLLWLVLFCCLSSWASDNTILSVNTAKNSQTNQVSTLLDTMRQKIQAQDIAASAYLVKDVQSQHIFAAKNPDKIIEPAALTQLMTTYLVFQALNDGILTPEQTLTVSETAWQTAGSRMFLVRNQPVKVRELVLGLVVVSANDAAITLAEAISGSHDAFVQKMNEQAQQLGMNHTHFANATGWPADNHVSTVHDLSLLTEALMNDFSDYYKLFAEKTFTYNGITQINRNLLLHRDNNIDGLKAGFSEGAGYHLIASNKRHQRRVISILIGAASAESRATESSKLLNYALQQFDTVKFYLAGQSIAKIRVYQGNQRKVNLGFLNDTYLTLPHGLSGVTLELSTEQPLLAPIKKGQTVGILSVKQGEKVVTKLSVVSLDEIKETGFFGLLWDNLCLWWQNRFH